MSGGRQPPGIRRCGRCGEKRGTEVGRGGENFASADLSRNGGLMLASDGNNS